jgi:hypothetical protein
MTKTKESTAMATKDPAATSLAKGAVTAEMLLGDAVTTPQFDRDDLAIPFIRVLQKGSPEVNPRDSKYVEGAEIGDFFNTVTRETYDGQEGIVVVMAAYTKSFIEWRTRDAGGGFVADHGANEDALKKTTRDDRGRDMTPEGTQITRNALYFIKLVNPETGDATSVALALSSTQLKKARQWNTIIANQRIRNPTDPDAAPITPRPYYMSYRLTTVPESNDKGDWMGVKIEPYKPTLELPHGDQLYLSAKDAERLFLQGALKTTPIQDSVGADDDELANQKF